MRASSITGRGKDGLVRSGALDVRFTAQDWEGMTPSQRIERCTEMADEAMKLAHTASQRLAQAYLQLAEQWLRLANEIGAEGTQQAKDH